MGIVGQHRPSALGPLSAYHPVVAAHTRPAGHVEVMDSLLVGVEHSPGHAAADVRIGQDAVVVLGGDQAQVGRFLRSQLADEQGAQQLRLPVGRQPPAYDSAPGGRV